MTIEEVQERVKKIEAGAGDDEMAHSEEDRLHQDVLAYIAGLDVYAGEVDGYVCRLAAEALKTREIEFSRWCA